MEFELRIFTRFWNIPISQWREGMGFWRDFLSESWRDRIAGQRPAPWLRGGGRSLACHFILTTFPKEILRKIQNFLRLVNKENILCSIGLIWIFYPSCRYLYAQSNISYVLPIKPSEPAKNPTGGTRFLNNLLVTFFSSWRHTLPVHPEYIMRHTTHHTLQLRCYNYK